MSDEEERSKPVRSFSARIFGGWFSGSTKNTQQQKTEPVSDDVKIKEELSTDTKRQEDQSTDEKRKEEQSALETVSSSGASGGNAQQEPLHRKAESDVQSGDTQQQSPQAASSNATAEREEEESTSADALTGVASAGFFAGMFGNRRKPDNPRKPAPVVLDSIISDAEATELPAAVPALTDESTTTRTSWDEWPKATTAKSPQSLPSKEESKEPETMEGLEGLGEESGEIGNEDEQEKSSKKSVAFKAAAIAVVAGAGTYAVMKKLAKDDDDEPTDDPAGNIESMTGKSSQAASKSASKAAQ